MPAGRPRNDQQLSHCREEGLKCQDCVHRVAASMSRICSDLSPAMARQLFPMVFPDVICAGMSGSFAQAVAQEQLSRRVPRRMPSRHVPEPMQRPLVAAAVA